MTTYNFTSTGCDHKDYTYRKAKIDFYLFEFTMMYKVCHKCHKLIKTQNRWKFNIN